MDGIEFTVDTFDANFSHFSLSKLERRVHQCRETLAWISDIFQASGKEQENNRIEGLNKSCDRLLSRVKDARKPILRVCDLTGDLLSLVSSFLNIEGECALARTCKFFDANYRIGARIRKEVRNDLKKIKGLPPLGCWIRQITTPVNALQILNRDIRPVVLWHMIDMPAKDFAGAKPGRHLCDTIAIAKEVREANCIFWHNYELGKICERLIAQNRVEEAIAIAESLSDHDRSIVFKNIEKTLLSLPQPDVAQAHKVALLFTHDNNLAN